MSQSQAGTEYLFANLILGHAFGCIVILCFGNDSSITIGRARGIWAALASTGHEPAWVTAGYFNVD